MLIAVLALIIPALCSILKGHVDDLEPVDLLSTSLVLRNLKTQSRQRQIVTSHGNFEFYELQPDTDYILSLDSDTLEIGSSFLVSVKEDGDLEIHRVSAGRPIDKLGPRVAHPINLKGKRKTLVVDRANFSLLKFFSQPMVLFSLGALLVVTYLPSMIQGLDPELLEELQKNQIQGGSGAKKLSNMDLAKSIAEKRAKKQ